MKLVVIITAFLLSACTTDLDPETIEKIASQCNKNDGLQKVKLYGSTMPHIYCNDGAEFWLKNK